MVMTFFISMKYLKKTLPNWTAFLFVLVFFVSVALSPSKLRSEQMEAGERDLAGRNPFFRGEELESTLSCCSTNPALGCHL